MSQVQACREGVMAGVWKSEIWKEEASITWEVEISRLEAREVTERFLLLQYLLRRLGRGRHLHAAVHLFYELEGEI